MALIDRDALGVGRCNPDSMLDPAYAAGWNGLLNIINSAPAVDAVEVVRCRECKRKEACICVVCEDGDMIFCAAFHRHMNPDDFCSYGERKEHD